ncbi:hypothetical protein [Halocatena salina]|uniref:Uncharacterized protein n=1 Tax=Halocatena salina TaxID=2934340 RepID=A0A8T9ZZZ5_9EURY|nr:hypothetical protein [Halocatena salina]UPM42431.1 hypothetical protein MW046_10750 [Halocatena salina]
MSEPSTEGSDRQPDRDQTAMATIELTNSRPPSTLILVVSDVISVSAMIPGCSRSPASLTRLRRRNAGSG